MRTVFYCLDMNHAMLLTEMGCFSYGWDGVNHDGCLAVSSLGIKGYPSTCKAGLIICMWDWGFPTWWWALKEIYILVLSLPCGGRDEKDKKAVTLCIGNKARAE